LEDVVVLQARCGTGLGLIAEHTDLDIVTLDIAMVGMDGFQTMKELVDFAPYCL
jgi:CheY-like chemotaxis protein